MLLGEGNHGRGSERSQRALGSVLAEAGQFCEANDAEVPPSGIGNFHRYPVGAGDVDETDLLLAPADGGPVQTFWSQAPPHSGIYNIWPDGAGGWVMVGAQLFDDHLFHSTVWLLDAAKTATRVGCSPGDSNRAWMDTGVAVAPNGVYAISKNLDASTWEIDRIAR